jgi:hypothetical protein
VDVSASPYGTNVFSLPHHLNENGDRSWNEWQPSNVSRNAFRSLQLYDLVLSTQVQCDHPHIEQMVKKCLTFLENPVKVALLLILRKLRSGLAPRTDPRTES